MRVWIHKNDDYIRKYLQPDTDINYIEDNHDIGCDGIVLLRSDDIMRPALREGALISHYDKDLEQINQLALERLSHNYDYYALDYQMSKEQYFDTLAVGSSYMLFGLKMNLLPTWRNLALGSQDIYYSYQLARKMFDKHKYKRLFWGGHYYTIYSDLSREKNATELSNITNIYSKIFPNSLGLHNALTIPNRVEEKFFSGVYDIEKSMQIFIKEFFDSMGGVFWNQQVTRFSCRTKLWKGENITWVEVSENEKRKAAKYRASCHNKSIRYVESFEENIGLFAEMGKWCLDNNIELYILNFPVTKFYHDAENRNFKEIFYDTINSFNFPAVLLDFDEIEFEDEYFNDPDHLNDKGAEKLTKILLSACS